MLSLPVDRNPAQQIAVIDLGSNTARLIVLRAVPGYAYRLEDEIREVVRLRQGMTRHGLGEAAMRRALFALRLFKRFCDSRGVDAIIASTTSAVREAANGQQFVERVRQEIGLSLQVLDGEREAYYATLGVLNEVPLREGYVVDIGGGSAQVSRVEAGVFSCGQALPLGALALTERFVDADPVSDVTYERLEREIEDQLDQISWFRPLATGEHLAGLGGTIRNLARIEARRAGYPLNTLHGYTLHLEGVHQALADFRQLPLAERKTISGLSSDRADIILPGAIVLATMMKRVETDQILISVNGLREGLFLESFWEHLSYPVVSDVRRFGVLNLARIYRYEKNHANHVRYLAGRLFDELQSLHHYGPAERRLLDAAALLHDLGTLINYDAHHKHSETLIANSGLPGFAPRETALIALLARYHRKGNPTLDAYEVLAREGDDLLLRRLAAILRLAEFMERGRNAMVDDVAATWDEESLVLTLIAVEYPAVEIWETERNALELVESAFDRTVTLESTAAPDGTLG